MKVQEMIDRLSQLDPNKEIMIQAIIDRGRGVSGSQDCSVYLDDESDDTYFVTVSGDEDMSD